MEVSFKHIQRNILSKTKIKLNIYMMFIKVFFYILLKYLTYVIVICAKRYNEKNIFQKKITSGV